MIGARVPFAAFYTSIVNVTMPLVVYKIKLSIPFSSDRDLALLRRHVPEKIKEEVVLLFLKVALFENSNKGEGGVDPFLPRSTTHSLHACHVFFVDPVQGSSFVIFWNVVKLVFLTSQRFNTRWESSPIRYEFT